jgi:hypothetical protein
MPVSCRSYKLSGKDPVAVWPATEWLLARFASSKSKVTSHAHPARGL